MKFLNAIFCDDIRQEVNNKLSLMGLYNDRMVLNVNKKDEIAWPQPINLSAFLRFSIEKDEAKPDHFEFEYYLNKKTLIKIMGKLDSNAHNKSQFQLVINAIGIPLEPGNLGFSIKLYAKDSLLLSEKQESALNISINE